MADIMRQVDNEILKSRLKAILASKTKQVNEVHQVTSTLAAWILIGFCKLTFSKILCISSLFPPPPRLSRLLTEIFLGGVLITKFKCLREGKHFQWNSRVFSTIKLYSSPFVSIVDIVFFSTSALLTCENT